MSTISRITTFERDHLCMVQVEDADGAVGWGQAAPYHADITTTILHRLIGPACLGRPCATTADIDAMATSALHATYKFHGTFQMRALAGVETACWDLLGRRSGQAVASLLGGKPGPVAVYGSSMSRTCTPEEECERMAAAHASQGMGAFKLRLGHRLGGEADPAAAEARGWRAAELVAKTLGARCQLLADANGSYDAATAISNGRRLADLGVGQFEEPCPHLDLDATAAVTAALSGCLKVSGGEQDYHDESWRRLIDAGAVHIVQPDVLYIGGVSRCAAVMRRALAAGQGAMPHCANHSLIQIITAHLCCGIPGSGPWMEYSLEHTPWTDHLFTAAPMVKNGVYPCPDGPGWGVEVAPEWIASARRREVGKD